MTDYLNASTEPKLRAIAEEELVKAHATTLIEVRCVRRCLLIGGVCIPAYLPVYMHTCLCIQSITQPHTHPTPQPPQMENSGCKVMLRDDKVEDLRRMYALFSRVPPTLEGLRASMAEFVRAAGRELVADQEQQKACGGGILKAAVGHGPYGSVRSVCFIRLTSLPPTPTMPDRSRSTS